MSSAGPSGAPRLPVDEHVPHIVALVREHGAAVLVAPPGAGKTTRVPPALAGDGPTVLLQPRRVAARALARRIAEERGWTLGREVGWQVRFERNFSRDTRLLVATEGILTARLQQDPLLSDVRTVVLDEFHERSLHADLALALVRQARAARRDLRVVVMSATLDAEPVAEFLDGAPVVELPGRLHPIEVDWAPGLTPAEAVRRVLPRAEGHLLCFLPGAPEIRRVEAELRRTIPASDDVSILPLHGSLDADAQDAALASTTRRKIILATNLAESSLTVEGVTEVIDSGLHKVLRRDPGLGIDRLETERISADSAEQRAGRAGRTAPGRVLRLWDSRDRLRAQRQPEIERVDLAAPLLDVLAWGGDPREFEWFEAPPADSLSAALGLLGQLGALDGGRLTDVGRALRRLPLHPRLGRMLLAAGMTDEAAAGCAILSEGWRGAPREESTDSDLLSRIERIDEAPRHVRRVASEIARLGRKLPASPGATTAGDEPLCRAILAGYPDRAAQRRQPGSRRLLLASGHGAVLAAESGVHEGEFLVAMDLVAGRRGPGTEALVRLASRVERDWLSCTATERIHEFDAQSGAVRAIERRRHHALLLSERTVEPDANVAAQILADVLLERGLEESAEALRRRLAFAGIEVDLPALLRDACYGARSLPKIDLRARLPFDTARELEGRAPETLEVPSGRRVRLEYRPDGSVVAAVKLQELFGLAETPQVGGVPVTLSLLAPNGRPVQTTTDLRGFWDRTYPQVRKELRGRYPKHPWPEDPWSALPTAKTKRRPSRKKPGL